MGPQLTSLSRVEATMIKCTSRDTNPHYLRDVMHTVNSGKLPLDYTPAARDRCSATTLEHCLLRHLSGWKGWGAVMRGIVFTELNWQDGNSGDYTTVLDGVYPAVCCFRSLRAQTFIVSTLVALNLWCPLRQLFVYVCMIIHVVWRRASHVTHVHVSHSSDLLLLVRQTHLRYSTSVSSLTSYKRTNSSSP